MNYQEIASVASEGDMKGEDPFWPSNPQVSNRQVRPPVPKMGTDESASRTLIEYLITISLILASIGPVLLLTAALDSLNSFGFAAIGYLLAGSLGPPIIRMARRSHQTTSVVPKESGAHQPKLKESFLNRTEVVRVGQL